MRGWRAWHESGDVYNSREHDTALPDGVVGFVEYLEPPYREIVCGGDWYWHDGERWRKVRTHPGWGRLSPPPRGVERPIRSGALSDDEWEEVQDEMMATTEPP